MWCDVCMGINTRRCPVCGTEPEKITCPNCGGFGLVNCTAVKVDSEDAIDVSAETYLNLPFDESEAMLWEQQLYRGNADICPVCRGQGKVWTEDGEYYPII